MNQGKPEPRTVEVPDRAYQPPRGELREDLRLKSRFEGTIKVMVQPVRVERVLLQNHSKTRTLW